MSDSGGGMADTARLDWLEQHGAFAIVGTKGSNDVWAVRGRGTLLRPVCEDPTLRAAIDAAREAGE